MSKAGANTLHSKRHNNEKFDSKYEMGKKLGEGNFASVFEAKRVRLVFIWDLYILHQPPQP